MNFKCGLHQTELLAAHFSMNQPSILRIPLIMALSHCQMHMTCCCARCRTTKLWYKIKK